MGFKSKLTTLHIAYSVQVKSYFHRSIMLGPSWVCNLNHWKNNALSPPPVLYRRYTTTMRFILSPDATDSSLMRL